MRRIFEKGISFLMGEDREEEETIAPHEAFGKHVDTALHIQNLKKQRRSLIGEGKGDTEEVRDISAQISALEKKKGELRDIALSRKVS